MFLQAYKKCPVCDAATEENPTKSFLVTSCLRCSHKFLQMPVSQTLDIKALYESENYYSDCGGSGMTSEGYIKNGLEDGLSRFYFNIRLKELARVLPTNSEVKYLDYGSSAGQIVAMAQKELGWSATGIDLSPTSVGKAQSLGINVKQGDIETLIKSQERYHAISLYHCLEHIIDPTELLNKMRLILHPGAVLAIEVPNINSAISKFQGEKWKGLLLPYHIQHFSESSLIRLLENCGYHIERVWTPYYPQATSQIFNIGNIYRKAKRLLKKNNENNSTQTNQRAPTREVGTSHKDSILRTIYYPFDKGISMLGSGEALSVIARVK